MEIPKIIFQTWKTYDVPDHWKYGQKTVKERNKDWKYVLLSDEDNLAIVKKISLNFYLILLILNIIYKELMQYGI